MKRILFILLLLIGQVNIPAQNNDFDRRVAAGIDQIYSIKFEDAEHTFRSLMADYPKHPAGRFFLAMIDWWKILLDLEVESHDDIFFAKLEDVIFQCDGILDKEPGNVDALFFKGGAIGFRGRLRAIRESWLKAADDGREALPIVHNAYKINPGNVDIQLGFGIYNYYAAVIPDRYPFIKPVMVFFPKGEKEKGIAQLANVAANGKYARYESQYFLMTLYYQFEENFYKALEYAGMLTGRFPDNPVFERYKGRILVKSGRFPEGYEVFRDVYDKCAAGRRGYDKNARREASYYVAFQHRIGGRIDSAMVYFRECENISRQIDKDEESGFRINSVLYLGMLADQKGEREQALRYYRQLLDMRKYGDSQVLAKRYIEKPYGK